MEIQTRTLMLDQWLQFKDNPIQRNTEDHARKALKYHLSTYSPTQQCVVGAVFNNVYYKVDGHTRSYLWEHELLQKPEHVIVTIYTCTSFQQITDLYSCFDTNTAAETSIDKYAGACRLVGFEPKSSLIKKCPVATIYRILTNHYSMVDMYGYVKLLLPVLKKIDNLNLSKKYSVGPFLAMLVTFLCHDSLVVSDFWINVNKDHGTKDISSGMDGIQAAIEIINYKNKTSLSGHSLQIYQCEQLLACFEIYIQNKRVKRRPSIKNVNIHDYMRNKCTNWIDLGVPTKSIRKPETNPILTEPDLPDHHQVEL